MNERVNVDTNKTLKLSEIPKQKHLVFNIQSTRMNSFTGTPGQIKVLLKKPYLLELKTINLIFLFVLS